MFWWKEVDYVPVGGVRIAGESHVVSKWNPFWRFLQPWYIFEVERIDDRPYYVFFKDKNTSMVCKALVKTNKFAARVSCIDIRFAAAHEFSTGRSLAIKVLPKKYNWLEMNVSTRLWLVNLFQRQYLYNHDVTLV